MSMTFKQLLKLLNSDFTAARCELAAMAITHIQSKGSHGFYQAKLGYELVESMKQSVQCKLAYKYMKNEGFKTSELLLMARA
ncbi:hypothetical protein [Vibrio alginolyticus]|uniref:hypothetical protein n=1 Tax=Vibrio alginolyticus TaxID=663 RepID=UPI0006CA7C4E|nr:hypothetical protein [Vibrio alginolyticus]KPM98454.1 hypothetical protein AOG25_08395 [Vibrio alginolyticus]CAH7140049.1 conserved hypothetical protein [Vibrio chagasii]CAH7231130.1 conserved hypothetical protein [Vibrio chagasii]